MDNVCASFRYPCFAKEVGAGINVLDDFYCSVFNSFKVLGLLVFLNTFIKYFSAFSASFGVIFCYPKLKKYSSDEQCSAAYLTPILLV